MSGTAQSFPLTTKVSAAMPPDLIWRLSVDQYHTLIRAGILTEDDPVELLEGWLVYKMPKIPAHRVVTHLIRQALERMVPAGWYVDTQEPITTAASEPEPDVMVIRGETRRYLNRHPEPQEVALVVEVSDATLQRDRIFKKRLYAQAGIPIYWIVNLAERQIEVYTNLSDLGEQTDYRQNQVYRLSDSIPFLIEGNEVGHITVQELMP